MADITAIEWTDATWSPWEGCTKVSPGCDHCYAEGMNRWLRKGANWGPGAPRRQYSDDHWLKPFRWNAKAAAEGRTLRVFPSVCDPFDNEVEEALRGDFLALVEATPNLTWLLLTKRIGNVQHMLADLSYERLPANVWLGATVVNQAEADRDIPKLLAVPARVRFLSIEPMLGPVDLQMHLHVGHGPNGWFQLPAIDSSDGGRAAGGGTPRFVRRTQELHWVICGAESGPKARPAQLEWMRSIVQQCRAAGVAPHVKQLGRVVFDWGMSSPGQHWPAGTVREHLPRRTEEDPPFFVRLNHPKGGDMDEWPEDLRIRDFPEVVHV